MRKIVENWVHTPGVHCASTGIRNVMNYSGFPYSEALCFGIGAGVSFAFLTLKGRSPSRYMGFRSYFFEENFFKNMELDFEWKGGKDPHESLDCSRDSIRQDIPVMTQSDIYYLPHFNTKTHFAGHVVTLWGFDDEKAEYYVTDTEHEGLLTVPYENMAKSISSTHTVSPQVNAWAPCMFRGKQVDLEKSVRVGLMQAANDMVKGKGRPSTVAGVQGMHSLAASLDDWKNDEDWKWSLRFAYQVIEKRGSGGGAFRIMYADFLREAEDILPEVKGLGLAQKMNDIASEWTELAARFKEMSEKETPGDFSGIKEQTLKVAGLEDDFFTQVLNLKL